MCLWEMKWVVVSLVPLSNTAQKPRNAVWGILLHTYKISTWRSTLHVAAIQVVLWLLFNVQVEHFTLRQTLYRFKEILHLLTLCLCDASIWYVTFVGDLFSHTIFVGIASKAICMITMLLVGTRVQRATGLMK